MPQGEHQRKLSDAQRAALIARYLTPNPDGTFDGSKILAREFGVTTNAIIYNLQRAGVPLRSSKASHAHGKRCKPIKNLPWGNAPPCKCGCGNAVPWSQRANRWLLYCAGHYRPHALYKDAYWLDIEYTIKQRTTADIAAQFGVNATTIIKFLRKHRIGIRPQRVSLALSGGVAGERNPAWKDGRAQWDYASAWKRLSREIRRRDGYMCQKCGIILPPPSKRLHVHHIDSNRFNNASENLVTLCASCHPKGARTEAEFVTWLRDH